MKWSPFIISLFAFVFLAGCAAIDRNERNVLTQHNVSPVVYDRMLHGEPLALSDIIELSQRQVPSSLVIRYLRSTRAVYDLDKQALARLNQAKVDRDVIEYLLQTPALFAPRAYYYGRPWYAADAYYPNDAYYPYYYPYYPQFYGRPSVVVVAGRRHWR